MRTKLIVTGLAIMLAACDAGRSPGSDDPGPDDPGTDDPGDDIVVTDDPDPLTPMDGGTPPGDDGSVDPPEDGSRPDPSSVEPGGACGCDTDCQGTSSNPGICLNGICMTQATGACSAAGSQAECPDGSRCWGVSLGDTDFDICWPDCDAHECDGDCDGDGSCVFSDDSTCDNTCADICTPPYDGSEPTGDCPPNSHAEGDGCVCDEGFVVNADRTACVAECTSTEDCPSGLVCEDMACVEPPCTPTSCPAGSICAPSGMCVTDVGTPPPGPVPTTCTIAMGIPDWRCTSGCSSIVQFDPDMGTTATDGWWDYPLNGETSTDQYRSYIRRDVMNLVKYAASMVRCMSAGWSFGNGGLLGLGDMSEMSGAIPGTREGDPGHPAGTHVNGHDMDIAYYQTGTADNTLRSVCPHGTGASDAYHCTGSPTNLDVWRTALFIAYLHDNSNLRVIGVDGRVGPLVESAVSQLCSGGWIPSTSNACRPGGLQLAYETTDGGAGWYYFHHHHLHISISG